MSFAKKILLGVGSRISPGFGLVEHDEIDVAGIVELARAELAHRQDEHAAGVPRIAVAGRHQSLFRGGTQKVRERNPKRRIGERAERLHDRVERPQSGDVGDRGRQRHPPPRDPQGVHQLVGRAGALAGKAIKDTG